MEHYEIPQAEKADAEKRKKFEEIFHGEPEAIFILSGDIVPRKRQGKSVEKFKSTAYSEPDERGAVLGGKARVVAGAEAASVFPDALLVTTSRTPEKEPTHAKVMGDELKRLGVPDERIMLEEKSIDTVTELIEMVKLAVSRGWKRVSIISSNYHLPRIKEMFSRLDAIAPSGDEEFINAAREAKESEIKFTFVSAEDVLPERSERYAKVVKSVKELDTYKKRLDMEEKGIEDLKSGRYKYKGRPPKSS